MYFIDQDHCSRYKLLQEKAMAPTFAFAFLALIISTTASRTDYGQQKDDNGGDGSTGGDLPSGGGGYGMIPPIDGSGPKDGGGYGMIPPIDGSGPKDGSGSYPMIPGMGTGPSNPIPTIPTIPKFPGPFPTHPFPGHGTCDFWSSNFGSWPSILSTMSTIGSVFGKPASSMFPSSMTLLQALQNGKNDAYSTLLKQASASLLNSYTQKNFNFSPDEVKSLLGAALTSPAAAAAQASQFARANSSV